MENSLSEMDSLKIEYERGKRTLADIEREIQLEEIVATNSAMLQNLSVSGNTQEELDEKLRRMKEMPFEKLNKLKLKRDIEYGLQSKRQHTLIVKWYENWASGVKEEANQNRNLAIERQTKINNAKQLLDSFDIREIQEENENSRQMKLFCEEEKALQARILEWRETVKDKNRVLQKEKEEAIYQLEKVIKTPVPNNQDLENILTKEISVGCPYAINPSVQTYRTYTETINISLKEIERLSDYIITLQTIQDKVAV